MKLAAIQGELLRLQGPCMQQKVPKAPPLLYHIAMPRWHELGSKSKAVWKSMAHQP